MSKEPEGSTRQLVLQLIKTKGPVTAGQLGLLLGITEMAVRRHLTGLERDGFIQTQIVRQAMGRPAHKYTITAVGDEQFPRNYHLLALDLLEQVLDNQSVGGTDPIAEAFERRQHKLFNKYKADMQGNSLGERVAALADIQNKGGYMAEWRRSELGDYFLEEYNCPISEIADRYHQACTCELALFRDLLETEVERTECLAKGGAKCAYLIRNS